MFFNEDDYWEHIREDMEGANRKVVETCACCGFEMHDGYSCYRINDDYYCQDCVQEETLHEYEPDYEED